MKFAFWDYAVMALYIVFVEGVAVIAKKGQDSLEDSFTGGKNLPWWLSILPRNSQTMNSFTSMNINIS